MKISTFISKIELGLSTYWHARNAIKRQFNLDRIHSVQNTRLQNLIRYSYNNTKYYKEILEQVGIKPEQIRTAYDLQNIPFLTKEELRNRFWDFLPHKLPACRVSRTSGSTGVPVCIFADLNSRKFNSAAVIRHRKALGIPIIGRPILNTLKSKSEPPKAPHWTFVQGIHKTYYINPYIDSAENIEYTKELVRQLKKPVLTGITPAIRILAAKIKDGFFPSFKPSVVMTGGEILSPEVRELVESTFGVKITDIYACNEARDVAWQCRQAHGYHINADNVIMEIVKDNKPVPCGDVGEVVITDLNRYAMPIIRYKNGDLAKLTPKQCPCGCKLPMIAEILGRTGEDIFLPNGRTVPWNQLKSLMTHQHVRKFQLVQNYNGSFTIKYIPERNADTKQLDELLLYRFRNLIGNSIEIKIEKTTLIPPAASGKSKLVVSHYKPRQ